MSINIYSFSTVYMCVYILSKVMLFYNHYSEYSLPYNISGHCTSEYSMLKWHKTKSVDKSLIIWNAFWNALIVNVCFENIS